MQRGFESGDMAMYQSGQNWVMGGTIVAGAGVGFAAAPLAAAAGGSALGTLGFLGAEGALVGGATDASIAYGMGNDAGDIAMAGARGAAIGSVLGVEFGVAGYGIRAGLGGIRAGLARSSTHGAQGRALGSWRNLPGGVRVKRTGNYWIKEVNPNANRLAQWWGRGSLHAQARGLRRLGNMAPNFIYKNGRIVTRDVGNYVSGNFWPTWARGSLRLRTPFNDIRPRNIGSNNLIFDPSKHPIQEGLEWGAAGLGIGVGGYHLYNSVTGD